MGKEHTEGKHGTIRPSLQYSVPNNKARKKDSEPLGTSGVTFKSLVLAFIGVIVIATGVALGLQYLKTGELKIFYHGKITLDNSLTEAERSAIQSKLTKTRLSSDIIVSASTNETVNYNEIANLPQLSGLHENTTLLVDVYVPVTGFYTPNYAIAREEAQELLADFSADTALPEPTDVKAYLIPINRLNNQTKLLAIGDEYYLDDYTNGAFFRTISIAGGSPAERIELANTILAALNVPTQDSGSATVENTATGNANSVANIQQSAFPTKNTVLTLAQTGVTALSRRMNTCLANIGNAGYFAEKIGPYLSSFDLTHTSNESSFSDRASGANICSDYRMFDVLTAIGLDIVELTGNHNQDCGNADAVATIDTYRDNQIMTFGGGENALAAATPLQISQKNQKITLLGYNYTTSGITTGDEAGANAYTQEKATNDILEAKARGDAVIVDMQFYECTDYVLVYESTVCDYADSSEEDQIKVFRELIDLGADIVVGTSAHQPQTYELYKDGVIYYGLGNLFFDQYTWPGTSRSMILENYFFNNRILQTRIRASHYDSALQPELYNFEDTATLIERWNKARPNQGD